MTGRQILLDATAVGNFHGGVGRYALRLVEALLTSDSDNRYRLVVQRRLAHSHPLYGLVERFDNLRIETRVAPALGPRRDLLFHPPPRSYDLFHSLGSNLPLLVNHRAIVTIHDLKYLRYPHYLGRWHRLKSKYLNVLFHHAVRRAAHVIAVSESTRQDLIERYGTTGLAPISVIHEASGIEASATPDSRVSHGAPYFLYVGELRPHKNLSNLLQAYDRFRRQVGAPVGDSRLPRLLIVGKQHASFGGFLAVPEGVEFRETIDNRGLAALYAGALALCLVSHYEGFGLPIVEAMSCGCPVITSDVSSMPEVAGEAALLIDPNRSEMIAEAMRTIYTDVMVRNRLKEKGLRRARDFSWRMAAQKTLQVYRSVFEAHRQGQ